MRNSIADDTKRVVVSSHVTDHSIRCTACNLIIPEDNWYLSLIIDGDRYPVHDNEYCTAALKVRMGLENPSFYSNINPLSDYYERKL